jgi:large subunit ribosomal protein L21
MAVPITIQSLQGTMYAVIESGGKQYRVELGNEIEVDRLEAEPGQTIQLERVLLVADGDASEIGRPLVDDAVVNADVVRQDRGDKIVVFKYKPKARTRVKKGFRADLTVLRISEIAFGGRSAARDAAAADAEAKATREATEASASKKATADQALAAKLGSSAKAETPSKTTKGSASTAKANTTKTTAKSSTTAKPKTTASRTQAGEDKTASKSSATRSSKSTAKADATTDKPTKAQKPADAKKPAAPETTKDE